MFSNIVLKNKCKSKYHSDLGDKSCGSEVLGIVYVCVSVCEAWDVLLRSEDPAPECQFFCTSWILNHIMIMYILHASAAFTIYLLQASEGK